MVLSAFSVSKALTTPPALLFQFADVKSDEVTGFVLDRHENHALSQHHLRARCHRGLEVRPYRSNRDSQIAHGEMLSYAFPGTGTECPEPSVHLLPLFGSTV